MPRRCWGGESLLGRYFLFKMFPLGPRDVVEGGKFKPTASWNPLEQPSFSKPAQEFKDALRNLYHLTGFPEPFLAGRKYFYRRWRNAHLSRAISAWKEWGWGTFGLSFVRTKDGRETDFLITRDQKALILVEAKPSGTNPDDSLRFFKEKLSVPLAFQVIWSEDLLRQVRPGLFVIDIYRFLNLLM